MDKLTFYKEVYFRELSRKESLDNNYSVNILTILSGLIVVNYIFVDLYINKINIDKCLLALPLFVFVTSFFLFCLSVGWLMKAYNNFFDGFEYANIPLLESIRSAEIEDGNKEFNRKVIQEISEVTSIYQKINTERNTYYFKSRKYLIGYFISTVIFIILYYIFQLT